MSENKILYIDNLKVLMTVLVILHHAFITYGAPGDWYYVQKTSQIGALIPMTIFVATNQSFFMGFFFFLSALFTGPSYDRKGAGKFIGDRLLRFGIPLLFYSLILSPVMNFLVAKYGHGKTYSFVQFLGGYHPWISFGVLWFVVALLLFTLVYALLRKLRGDRPPKAYPVPSGRTIFFFALSLGLVSFLVRLVFPVGWTLSPIGFQLGHFPQYIALFALGIVASRHQWLQQVEVIDGKKWGTAALLLVLVAMPVMYVLKTITNSPPEAFRGGLNWQSLLYSLWEQFTGLSIILALLSRSRRIWNEQSHLLKNMSRSAFAAYIFHPLFLIGISLLMRDLALDPAIKLLMAAPTAVVATFLFAGLLVKVPGVNKIV